MQVCQMLLRLTIIGEIMNRIEMFNDSFQNYKGYQLPKAQLVIAECKKDLTVHVP
jgi:hypothetical protein